MTYLVGLIVVGTLCLLNIALTVGVIRRLREHETRMQPPPAPAVSAPVGAEVNDFTAVSISGKALSKSDTLLETNFLFISADCAPCRDKLPDYLEYLRSARPRTVAVLTPAEGDDTHFTEMRDALSTVADVVVEPYGEPIWKAFAIVGTPAFITSRDGRIAATDLPLTTAGTAA
ncbi:TlpA family protein disulfide reductase [Nonomuraea zeae]|uniref:TlpA family protein disulfide reductase n=1 Tax=Nonomuraea zeae TaxID=1642303 RepID=A0A5S4F9V0_9ACTN|nr:TlpA family protein disulfide reductase [Nonomuraea zeae]TMR13899.1 TlpA family protein disulfide reductase [Nonomuraea zeae]